MWRITKQPYINWTIVYNCYKADAKDKVRVLNRIQWKVSNLVCHTYLSPFAWRVRISNKAKKVLYPLFKNMLPKHSATVPVPAANCSLWLCFGVEAPQNYSSSQPGKNLADIGTPAGFYPRIRWRPRASGWEALTSALTWSSSGLLNWNILFKWKNTIYYMVVHVNLLRHSVHWNPSLPGSECKEWNWTYNRDQWDWMG